MIRAKILVEDRIPQLHARVEQLARQATQAAVEAAAEVAQQAASIDLELEVIPPGVDPDGVSAGIRSQKTGARGARIAGFFDAGTLGKRRKKTKRPGSSSWPVRRGSGSYTAHRGDVTGKGIEPQRFFLKARVAGRKAMAAVVGRGI